MLEAVIPPLVAAYATFVAMVVVAARRPDPRSRAGDERYRGASWRAAASTAGGGYAAFLGIVLVFHVWLAGEEDALSSAVLGGGFLVAVTLGIWIVDSIVRGGPRHRR